MAERGEFYQAVEAHVKEVLPESAPHLLRTVEYVEQLDPNASEALLIAAVAHDLERAERSPEVTEIPRDGSDFLEHHQQRGAEMVEDFLKEQGTDPALISRVRELISRHEVGGDEEQNILKDADSISFLEIQADHFLTTKLRETSQEAVREKLDWMFNRISSDKARDLAQPFYESALRRLEEEKDQK